MIPLRDTSQSRNYPIINNLLIGINVLVYLGQMAQGPRLQQFILTYGLVPARYSAPEIAEYFTFSEQAFALLSFMFLHGSFWHLLGNMWTLYIFGDNVEDRLGPLRYLLFYLLCGWASRLAHLFTNWYSQVPTIGASGAIAGVMGAYFILYPKSKVLTFIPIFIIPYFVEVPAYLFLGIWFLFQFLSAAGSSGQAGGIAWWAHVGGFIAGVIILKLIERLPELGITRTLRQGTSRKSTPRLQVIRTLSSGEDLNLYGILLITPREALFGAKKLVNVPSGFRRRIFQVTVPPGIHDGAILRLAGMGKKLDEKHKGDLLLKINISAREGSS